LLECLASAPRDGVARQDEECRALDRVLEGARAGQSSALVICGEAGVGRPPRHVPISSRWCSTAPAPRRSRTRVAGDGSKQRSFTSPCSGSRGCSPRLGQGRHQSGREPVPTGSLGASRRECKRISTLPARARETGHACSASCAARSNAASSIPATRPTTPSSLLGSCGTTRGSSSAVVVARRAQAPQDGGDPSPGADACLNLPAEERRRLREEGYVVEGVGEPVPSVAGLTVLGAGMAICALLSPDGDVIPSGYWFDGMFGDAHETRPSEPRADCRCRRHLTLADAAVIPFIP
jgi:hypothetical protein